MAVRAASLRQLSADGGMQSSSPASAEPAAHLQRALSEHLDHLRRQEIAVLGQKVAAAVLHFPSEVANLEAESVALGPDVVRRPHVVVELFWKIGSSFG